MPPRRLSPSPPPPMTRYWIGPPPLFAPRQGNRCDICVGEDGACKCLNLFWPRECLFRKLRVYSVSSSYCSCIEHCTSILAIVNATRPARVRHSNPNIFFSFPDFADLPRKCLLACEHGRYSQLSVYFTFLITCAMLCSWCHIWRLYETNPWKSEHLGATKTGQKEAMDCCFCGPFLVAETRLSLSVCVCPERRPGPPSSL